MSKSSLLAQIRSQLTVDVDSMDPAVAGRHAAEAQFCDMTSNQAIVFNEASRPDRARLLRTACEQVLGSQIDVKQQVADALDLLSVLLAKEVFPHLSGRIHLQTSPAAAYSTEDTIAHAKKLVALVEANGMPKSRVCIKIPATPESVIACQYLQKIGIQTLATCLFSLPQALAANQADCLYVAPYFNELRVHFEPVLWKKYSSTVEEHPAIPIIRSVIDAFDQIDSKTLVMPASIVTVDEVVALASLGPHHLTLSGAVLDKLAAEKSIENFPPPVQTPKSTSEQSTDLQGTLHVDYLAEGAEALRISLAADAEATRKLEDALKIFDDKEQQTKDLIRKELVLLGN